MIHDYQYYLATVCHVCLSTTLNAIQFRCIVVHLHKLSHVCLAGKSGMKDWSLTMFGTETEPGQEVPPLVGDHQHSISQSDPTVHQVVDTTEGKTETRDPGTHLTGHPSLPSSASQPATTTLQPVPLERVLSVGCLRSSAVGACLGLCLVVVVIHLVVGALFLPQPSLNKRPSCCLPQPRLAECPSGSPAGGSAQVLLCCRGSIVGFS